MGEKKIFNFQSYLVCQAKSDFVILTVTASNNSFPGPSYAVDTACSSSMMCLDQALMNIRMGLIDNALVGGTNLCLKPQSSLQFTRMNMTAPDGTCKSFDASGTNLNFFS